MLLLFGSLALTWPDGLWRPLGPASSGEGNPAPIVDDLADSGRYATLWPFSKDSIWNLPIGGGARYVPANITKARAHGMTVDQDVIILTPGAPRTKVYYNDDAWNGGSRCNVEGGSLFEAPIPGDFVVPPARPGWTPNFATAILAGDNRTLIQGQPMARCSQGSNATIWWWQTRENLYGTGTSGGHGGSMLSSIGGTIRSGELVPGGAIRHAMKVNLDGSNNLFYDNKTWGFRWPAAHGDSCAAYCYRGKNPALRMGSLLALPPSIDLGSMGLETEPAKIVARAFQDYGGYVVDNTGWSVYALSTEYSPQNGWLEDEFERAWGFPIDPPGRDNPWARDMDRIFLALHVVNNWDAAAWATVRASNGALGAGGGAPRVSWAPDFGGAIPPPDLTPPTTWANLSGTAGPAPWYVSPVTVALTATDDRSGVARMHIRVDGGAWSGYFSPVRVSGEGRHKVEFYTTDIAGNDGDVEAIEFAIDATPPRTTATLTGTPGGDGWYRSPVTVALTATDGGSGVTAIEFRTNGGTWSPYVAPIEVTSDGRHTVEYRATDTITNMEMASQVSFLIDTQAPLVSHAITGPSGSSGWYRPPVSISLGPVGPKGTLTSIAYAVDGGSWTTYTGPIVMIDGRHTVSYQARYAAGNLGPIESITIHMDGTAPTVAIEDPRDAIPPDGTISWSGSDAESWIVGYEISVDGDPFVSVGNATNAAGPWSVGPHVLVVRALDAAGNTATTTFRFRVDLDAPRMIPELPAAGDHRPLELIQILIVLGTLCTILALLLQAPLRRQLGRGASPKTQAPSADPNAKPSEVPSDGPIQEPPQGWDELPKIPPEGPTQESPTESTVEPAVEPPKEPVPETPDGPIQEPPQGWDELPKIPPEGPTQESPTESSPVTVTSIAGTPTPGGGYISPAMIVDQNVIILTPGAPRTKVYYNDDARVGMAAESHRNLFEMDSLRVEIEKKATQGRGMQRAWILFLAVGVPAGLLTALAPLTMAGVYLEPLRPLWQPWPPDVFKPFIGIALFTATLALLLQAPLRRQLGRGAAQKTQAPSADPNAKPSEIPSETPDGPIQEPPQGWDELPKVPPEESPTEPSEPPSESGPEGPPPLEAQAEPAAGIPEDDSTPPPTPPRSSSIDYLMEAPLEP